MIAQKPLTIRHHRRAFQNWSFENRHDLSKKDNWTEAVTAYGTAHGLDKATQTDLLVAHSQFPRVVTAAWLD